MAQSGISYAAGQLLAVVAPRTVLVVDAPTDWSLAGPLWELALDDAPVDEILDVLVRRGIRTAPSFAIVRVEGEAVRALVRGSVPVCFERTGEPVRLDATGATTWLEGLISGARRVLVGDVDTTSDLPYLVSTGVVLVSGLALPCGIPVADASGELPQIEDIEPGEGGDHSPPSGAVPSSPRPAPSDRPFAPVGAAPRVVDLTRTAPRTPAQAFAAPEPASARAFAPAGQEESRWVGGAGGLNGHALAPVSDRESFDESELEPAEHEVFQPFDRESYEPFERQPFEREPFESQPEAFRQFAPSRPADDDRGFGFEAAPVTDEPASALLAEPEHVDEPAEVLDEPEAFESPAEPAEPAAPVAPVESIGSTRAPTSFFEAAAPERTDDHAAAYGDDYGDATAVYSDDDYDEPAAELPEAQLPEAQLPEARFPVAQYPEALTEVDLRDTPATVRDDAPADDEADVQADAPAGLLTDASDDVDDDVDDDADYDARADLRPDVESDVRPDVQDDVRVDEQTDEQDDEQDDEQPAARGDETRVDPFDDLLIDGEPAPGPSPADLPNFASPSVPVTPLPSATIDDDEPGNPFEFPQQSRFGSGSAPAAWPPPEAPAERSARSNGQVNGGFAPPSDADEQEEVGFDSLLADNFRPTSPSGPREAQHQPDRRELDRYDPLEAYQADEPGNGADDGSADDQDDDPQAGSLPFRVRGQSLRPEQRVPLEKRGLTGGLSGGLNGRSAVNRERPERLDPPGVDEPDAAPAVPVAGAPVAPVTPGPSKPPVSPSPSPSGGLLLPSFFRGARAARKTGSAAEADQPQAPAARDGLNGGNGNGNGNDRPWPAAGSGQAPSAWAPPVRRGLGDPPRPELGRPEQGRPEQGRPEQGRPDFGRPDGPPAMPGVLRQAPNGAPQSGTPGDAEPLREPPRLLGVWCDAGHVTSPDHDTCRVCGLPVPPQAPILVARPPLGVLVFDNGDRVEVDRPVVLGRDPKPVSSPDPESPVLHPVASATGQVSRTHAEVRAAGWDVVLTDLDAMNGTALTLPGETPIAIEPGVPTVIVPGARVDLGGETGFVFEIEG